MNLDLLFKYMKYLMNEDDGYFYTSVINHEEDKTYEVMIKNKTWKVRERNVGPWDEYKLPDKAILSITARNLSIQKIGHELQEAIVNSGLFHYMRFHEIQELVGDKLMKEGSKNMAAFAKILTKTIDKEVRIKYGKFELIKSE
jgi:hypothetical protein